MKISLKRLLIQIFFFILQNPLLKNFTDGTIYTGRLKIACTPGLNCYSCPAAVLSCPIGAMQLFFAGVKHNISLFVTGFLLSVGVVFGRLICGYVCPMGLLQDLIYKIKSPKKVVRLKILRYIKYFILIIFVIMLPLMIRHELSGLGEPWFCKFICPSGIIFGAIPLLTFNPFLHDFVGILFIIKLVIAILIILISIIIYRPFCRILCPLGAIYALLNKIAILRMRCDKEKCISCGDCEKVCKIMLEPSKKPNSPECIRCNECKAACKQKALK